VSNVLTIEGLAELREELQRLPAELTADASGIIEGAADAAETDIEAAYPERSGNLRKGVGVTRTRAGEFAAAAVVFNRAKHAYIFELGTQARHTDIGANRGSMPPGRVFIQRTMRHRAGMYGDLKQMVEAHGLEVSGEPDR